MDRLNNLARMNMYAHLHGNDDLPYNPEILNIGNAEFVPGFQFLVDLNLPIQRRYA